MEYIYTPISSVKHNYFVLYLKMCRYRNEFKVKIIMESN